MRFEFWPLLGLILTLPFLYRIWLARAQSARVTYSIAIPSSAVHRDPTPVLLGLRVVALALAIVALARPQASFKQINRSVDGIDIMLALDVSASMNAEDMGEGAKADASRFDIAKETIEEFVKNRQNDRIGLVIFSGEPITLAPLTLDYGLVLNALRGATSGILKDGTAIGDGLSLAIARLRDSKAKSRIIVLLTDGDNNVGQIDPGTAGALAEGFGIKVYTIAIGKEGRVRIPQTHTMFGQVVKQYQWMENALNPKLLEDIAKATHGKFYRVTEGKVLESVFKEINLLEKTKVESQERVRYEERFYWPLYFALLVFALERLLALGVYRGLG